MVSDVACSLSNPPNRFSSSLIFLSCSVADMGLFFFGLLTALDDFDEVPADAGAWMGGCGRDGVEVFFETNLYSLCSTSGLNSSMSNSISSPPSYNYSD